MNSLAPQSTKTWPSTAMVFLEALGMAYPDGSHPDDDKVLEVRYLSDPGWYLG